MRNPAFFSGGASGSLATTATISVEYGAEALDALRHVVAEAKAADPMRPVTILVPNHLAGIVARRHLARGLGDGTSGVAGIRVTTIVRLAEELAVPALPGKRPATRPLVSAAWRHALQEPGVFAAVADHAATVQALAGAHRELRDLGEAALDAITDATALAPDVVRMHRAVMDRLRGSSYDETDLLHTAADEVARGGAGRGAFVLYLPQDLNRAAHRFVAALQEGGELHSIIGTSGVRAVDARWHASTAVVKSPEASFDRILDASDSDDEVRCVVREVLRDLGTVPAHRIAILYSKREPYGRLLHEHLAAAGVTANGPGHRPLADRGVARGLFELLALERRDAPRADLFRALANAPARDFDGRRIPLSGWERVSRSAGVVFGDHWESRLGDYLQEQQHELDVERESVSPDSPRLEHIERRVAHAEGLQRFVARLRACFVDAAAMRSWRELGAWALALYESLLTERGLQANLPPQEQYAAASLVSILRGLADLDVTGAAADLTTFRDALGLELESGSQRVGRFGEGVFVGPISAAVGLDLDRVYLVGLAEDLYPGRQHEDALLPDAVRVASLNELPSARHRLDVRQAELHAALQAAPFVTVSVPRGDLRRSSARLPSRWLLPGLRRLSGVPDLALTAWDEASYGESRVSSGSFAGELLTTTGLATEQEWRTRAIAAGEQLTDAVVDAAAEMVGARKRDPFSRFDGNLTGVDGLPDLLVDERSISASSLERYAKCPHSYFVEKLLGVRPLESPEDILQISAMDRGSLIHACLDALAKEGPLPLEGGPWTPDQYDRMLAVAELQAAQYVSRGRTGHPKLWARDFAKLRLELGRMLRDDDARRAERGASILATELRFGMGKEPPVEIALAGGRLLVKGSADRIDRAADGTIYVIDLKTGRPTSFLSIEKGDPLVNGTKLQLPIYGHAARARYGDGPIRAEYWFAGETFRRIEVPLDGVEAQFAETVALLARSIRSGLFPARPPEKPDYGYVQCDYCNPDGVGHTALRERWERKRHDPLLADYVALAEGIAAP